VATFLDAGLKLKQTRNQGSKEIIKLKKPLSKKLRSQKSYMKLFLSPRAYPGQVKAQIKRKNSVKSKRER
jgi:hypothetical protein